MTFRRLWRDVVVAVMVGVWAIAVWAADDAVADLRRFVKEVRSGESQFTQVVTSPDGGKQRKSTGTFEFERPNRFRFSYRQPFEQIIVSNGESLWLFDADLNQVTVRPFSDAIGATPAALLASAQVDKDFGLKALPDDVGLSWVEAQPKLKDAPFQSLKIGFRAHQLAAVEIVDAFGQRSRLEFSGLRANVSLPQDRFSFSPPPGADVIRP